jgi:hypothetical protein
MNRLYLHGVSLATQQVVFQNDVYISRPHCPLSPAEPKFPREAISSTSLLFLITISSLKVTYLGVSLFLRRTASFSAILHSSVIQLETQFTALRTPLS